MTLPKITAPIYELTLPTEKKKVKFRPFTVREQKILLLALENDDTSFTSDNIKEVVKGCLLTNINVDNIPVIDLEFLFLNLRARSVGEIVELKYRCQNIIEEEKVCDNLMNIELDLLSVKIEEPEVKDTIDLTPTIGVKLRYPNYSTIDKIKSSEDIVDLTFDFVISCLEFIYDKENIYRAEDYKKEELYEFLESLTIDQFKKIEEFFGTIPKLRKTLEVTCKKCSYEHKIVIEGLENFFG